MNRLAGLGGGVALTMVLVWAPAAQVPGGRIAGVVVADGGPEHGEPVPGVTVAVRGGVHAQNTATDERGEFAFTDLAPGRYRITTGQAGYGGLELGAFRLGEEGTPVEVDGPRGSAHVMAQLGHWTALSGTVLNANGNPAVDVAIVVRAVGTTHPDDPAGSQARTDLRGRFRVPALARGQYVVSAIDTNRDAAARLVTYFPGTADPARAEHVTVSREDDRELPPMRLAPADARISGTVTVPDGRPAAGASVAVQNAWDRVATTTTDAEGRFEASVSAGQYDVFASTFDEPSRARGFEGLPRPVSWATERLKAAPSRPSVVTLALKPTATFSGKVAGDVAGGTVADVTVALRATGRLALAGTAGDRFDIDRIVPGSYGVTVSTGQDSAWWLKSATLNGRSLLAGPLELEPGMRLGSAVLTLSRDRGELSGLLTGRNGLLQTEYWVAVIPADASVRHPASPQIVRTRPATNGRFVFDRLPAGEYALAVFGDLGPGDWRKPDILTSLVAAGIKVTVPPGTPVIQNIRVER